MLYTQTSTQVPYIEKPIAIVIRAETPKPPEPPKPIEYQIKDGDTLTSIAEATHSTVQRLWSKNTTLANPDQISAPQVLIIPTNEEALQDRALPISIEIVAPTSISPGGFSYGNTYTAGQCTAFVKDTLGWVRNGWGNASDWAYNAQREGFTVSDTPRVGAVAWARAYGHVAVVINITGSTVTVQEQNYRGPFIVSTRAAPISEFRYIY